MYIFRSKPLRSCNPEFPYLCFLPLQLWKNGSVAVRMRGTLLLVRSSCSSCRPNPLTLVPSPPGLVLAHNFLSDILLARGLFASPLVRLFPPLLDRLDGPCHWIRIQVICLGYFVYRIHASPCMKPFRPRRSGPPGRSPEGRARKLILFERACAGNAVTEYSWGASEFDQF